MKATQCGGGKIYSFALSEIEYIGYFYGTNGNEDIRDAYTRISKERGKQPDFFMNAELFDFSSRKAASDVVANGKIHRLTEGYGIAFPENKTAVFSYKNNVNAKDYIGAYPLLAKNGAEHIQNPAGITGTRGRTALGLDGKNLYVALVPDKNGVTLSTLRRAFLTAGAKDAINLDGGGSTQFYAPKGNYFTGRKVRGFIGVWRKSNSEDSLKLTPDVRVVKVRTNLRIRTSASLLGKVVGRLYDGDMVTVLEEKKGWCRISSGWVSSAYLVK